MALVLLKMLEKGLRLDERALQRAAASASLWSESATIQVVAVCVIMQRLRDCTAFQQSRGMQALR